MTSTSRRRGFTLIELLIAMIVGVMVLTFSMQLVVRFLRNSSSADARMSLDRNERLIGTALQRDLQEAGVDLQSSQAFGSVYSDGNRLVILSIPYAGPVASQQPTPFYNVVLSTAQQTTALNGQGNCGTVCLRVDRTGKTWEPAMTDVLLFSTRTTRRLMTMTAAPTVTATQATFSFADVSPMLGHPSALREGATNVQLSTSQTGNTVQRLQAVAYYRQGDSLYRATRVNTDGTPQGELFASGVRSWQVELQFTDGSWASTASPTSATASYNDIAGVRVTAQILPEKDDARGINPGLKTYRWYVAPRNLTYERNRPASQFN